MMVFSDYKLRLRSADSSLSGQADFQTLAEVGVYGAVGLFLVMQLGFPQVVRRRTALLSLGWTWAAVMALSTFWAVYPLFAAVRGVQLLLIAALANAIAAYARPIHLHLFAHSFIALATVSVGLGVLLPYRNYGRRGFNWFYVHPVTVGMYLGLAVTLIVAYLVRSRMEPPPLSWPTWLYALALTMCAGGLVATLTRASMGAAVLGVLVAILYTAGRIRRVDALAVAALIVITALLGFAPTIVEFLARGQESAAIESFGGRTPLWTEAWALYGQRPLVGYGLTASQGLFLATVGLGGGHNALINVLVDGGTVGAFLWLCLIIGIFIAIRKLWGHPVAHRDLPMLLAAMVFLVVNSFTVESLATAANMANVWCYVILGWLGVLMREARATAPPPPTRGVAGVEDTRGATAAQPRLRQHPGRSLG